VAINDAEQASLEAWFARADGDYVQMAGRVTFRRNDNLI
jgi:hypothetical protein